MNRTSMSLWRGSRYLAIKGVPISQRRLASSDTPSPTASLPLVFPTCPAHSNILRRAFYKTFTRPVVKTLLTAVFIYQLTYWAWVRLEKDELKANKRLEIKELEAELEEVSEGAIKGEDVKVKGV
ncbi:hypothetical protein SBOR_7407 [Sclerotinia borealis F-4128]|uniref:Uncharacterized protein n=1 Tax=Sclerotinia borealis (strain F-4128) TaxID=1432307 RepID=W9C8S0_SCLBF|nr:hypothetical protein SBOR_7407 [Sclerotinia borealis F-4128]